MTGFTHKTDLIGTFAQHRVAANLLMTIMLLAGFWALNQLNTQFFPNFEVEVISVRVAWPGATAEDVERSVTIPLEQSLRDVAGLEKMTSTSSDNIAFISLEFPEGTDMGEASDRVKEKVDSVRNLPSETEIPEVSHVIRYEPVARVLVHGTPNIAELRHLVRQMERELLDLGIAKININGLPEEEVAIQVSQNQLEELGLSLSQVADRITAESQDVPAGQLGRDDVGRQLRTLNQQRSELGFEQLPLLSDQDGRLIRVADVAKVERRARPDQVEITYLGEPAVEMQVQRSPEADSLVSARILQDWLTETRPKLPPNVKLTVYDESWQLIEDRINLLLKNGIGGLILVVAILFLFLNGRVAWWVTVGIPVSFLATLAVLFVVGGSINMISLFALIMALGIIVDDAIVVGEDALAHYQTGESELEAAEGGARRMLAPVMSSSLTTIAAFIPLLSVSGIIGNILGDIPVVIICVILASLIESFFVLPGHLRHSFVGMQGQKESKTRLWLDAKFNAFRDKVFRPTVSAGVHNPWAVISIAFASVILVVGSLAGGRLGFTFFPNVEGNIVVASASFVAGTPPDRVEKFIGEVETAMYKADAELGGGLVRIAGVANGLGFFSNARSGQQGEQFASVTAELIPSDQRDVRNEAFLKVWEKHFVQPPGLESMTLTSRRGGHPGRDIEVRLTGADPDTLKAAGLEFAEYLKAISGVSGVEDDMPYGQQQLIYELTPYGQALGLTTAEVGRQLRGALDGYLAQIFNQGDEEIEVRIMLPDAERYRLSTLDAMNITLSNGQSVPLLSIIDLTERRGFKALRHTEGRLALTVFADVDRTQNNANKIREQIKDGILQDLSHRYPISWEFTGRAEDQAETKKDMQRGAIIALAMIYIVLAWVFASYSWPFVVMGVIPFALIGAFMGHWVMGIELTILSVFGFFGLAGIVVNDSIILVVFYKHLRKTGLAVKEAVIEAACQRLRAVLLTSLTTIAGLLPLLFETSLQAQFLIPMAISISFGLAFATFLVLFMVPTLLASLERIGQKQSKSRQPLASDLNYSDR